MRLTTRILSLTAGLAAAALLATGLSTVDVQRADAATSCTPNASATTPSVAVQDACGNHAMGSGDPSIAEHLAAAAQSTATQGTVSATRVAATNTAAQTYYTPDTGDNVLGFDVSGWQTKTDWVGAVKDGYKFVFVKSTESNNFVNPYFNGQWVDAGKVGLLRGAYHFAQPSQSSGAAQAKYFYQHGAAMSATTPGTLAPVLDIENSNCAGMKPAAIVSWISSFMSTLRGLTGRTPIIYTYKNWWNTCAGSNTTLPKTYPLWAADPTPTTATQPRIPAAWKTWSFWQWGAPPFSGGGDANVWHGTSVSTLTSQFATYPRISGTDRWATSTQAAQQFVSAAAKSTATTKPAQTVFIASGQTPSDALAGGGAAGTASAPIMLTSPTSLPPVVASQLAVIKPQRIIVLGGPNAVSTAVQKKLAAYTASGSAIAVQRLSGADRYATSAAIAKASFKPGVAHAYIAVGTSWADALTGSAVAASAKASGPVLLVSPTGIPSSVASALSTLRPGHITVLGGTAVVSSAIYKQLARYVAGHTTKNISRLGGSDRWDTARLIATHNFGAGVPVVYLASGTNFPDALSGAPLSRLVGGAPVLLTQQGKVPPMTAAALAALKPKSIVVLGGSASVSAYVQSAVKKYVVK